MATTRSRTRVPSPIVLLCDATSLRHLLLQRRRIRPTRRARLIWCQQVKKIQRKDGRGREQQRDEMKMRREGKEVEDCGDEDELGTNDGNSAEVGNGDRQQ